ncbi:MAG TPA: ABC transporter permease [Candidatus Thermoplasmatota archaeon]|nr:ABC transporter permease [Candidatus Thermoplasmatota archaeon]
MLRLPWHVAFVPNRRAMLTACGIALGVAFALLSFSVVAALSRSTIELGEHLKQGEVAVARNGLAPFHPEETGIDSATQVLIVHVREEGGNARLVVALEGEGAPVVEPGTFRPIADYDDFPFVLRITEPSPIFLTKDSSAPRDGGPLVWPRVSPEDARRLDPNLAGGKVSYLIAIGMTEDQARTLAGRGFVISPAPAVNPFFGTSTQEVARSLVLVVVVAAVFAALFAYEFFRSEIREKRREIALWRAVGMRARDVLALLLARALALSTLGVALGSATIIALLAVGSFASGVEILRFQLGARETLLLCACFVLAGVAGSLMPTLRVARASIARALEEPA